MSVPDYSFVLHTINPITKDAREVYAEVAIGLGETLVSADTPGTPYRFACNKAEGSVTTLAFANFSTGRWPGTQGGIVQRTIDYSKVDLSREPGARLALGARLAALGRLIEHALESPQDVEGGLLGEEIYLFQSRPQQGLE
jgi:phosphoglucan,water dikinase